MVGVNQESGRGIVTDNMTCLAGIWVIRNAGVGPVDVDYKQNLRSDLIFLKPFFSLTI
jgi:hypothetical protein